MSLPISSSMGFSRIIAHESSAKSQLQEHKVSKTPIERHHSQEQAIEFLKEKLGNGVFESLTTLELSMQRSQDYLDYLRPEEVPESCMQGVDYYGSPFLVVKYHERGKSSLTFVQLIRISTSPEFTLQEEILFSDPRFYISKKEHDMKSQKPAWVVPFANRCPFFSDSKTVTMEDLDNLSSLLQGKNSKFILA
jgi:hypothetical protein